MLTITINGFDYRVPAGTTILEAARSNGFYIPTLCYHEALEPFGSCRLCLVEVAAGFEEGGTVTSSCTYPIEEEGLFVQTETPAVLQARKVNLGLLLARRPGVECLQELAHSWWVDISGLPLLGDFNEACILCGRCVRVCREAIGKNAISFAFRGVERKVSAPFDQLPDDCIGCTACAHVCPTGAVKVAEENNYRLIEPWQSELELIACADCGVKVTPQEQALYLAGKLQQEEIPLEIMRPGLEGNEDKREKPAERSRSDLTEEGEGKNENQGEAEKEHRENLETGGRLLCPRCRRRRVTAKVGDLPGGKFSLSRISYY